MELSVVIRTCNEADRLRLTLASLVEQDSDPEIIVVDDGSVDQTQDVIAEAASQLKLRSVCHKERRGRSAASNVGAAMASGDVLLFLDGDTLAGPALTEAHLALHRADTAALGRGETWHLRCTRFLKNPETGEPRPGEEARVSNDPAALRRLLVTREQILCTFRDIEARAQPGIYPGYGPRRLYELEMDALRNHPDCEVLWAASSGSNFSMRRRAFLDVGGFHPLLDNNEHRELALRLYMLGNKIKPVVGARTYHLTHRVGWRDPLSDRGWEEIFYRAHPIAAVKLLPEFWMSIGSESVDRTRHRIMTLPALAEVARQQQMAEDQHGS